MKIIVKPTIKWQAVQFTGPESISKIQAILQPGYELLIPKQGKQLAIVSKGYNYQDFAAIDDWIITHDQSDYPVIYDTHSFVGLFDVVED